MSSLFNGPPTLITLSTDRTNPQEVKELEDIYPCEYECITRNSSLRSN